MKDGRDPARRLPASVTVIERGWLSANMVVIRGASSAALVDTGYWTHAQQTLELAAHALGELPLSDIVNTHLHSDHCGGNAALQAHYPSARTWIPPGQAEAVRQWDTVALSYEPTGQSCPRFRFDGLLEPGGEVVLGDQAWQVHCAPGHDPHSVVLFEPQSRSLISADALWQNGFGVVFEELEGGGAFPEVADTLDLIERLAPDVVIPGHGPIFSDAPDALARARSRLAAYVADPRRHASHAAKVLLKFKLLELQRVSIDEFTAWAESAPYFRLMHDRWFPDRDLRGWLFTLLADLEKAGAATSGAGFVANA